MSSTRNKKHNVPTDYKLLRLYRKRVELQSKLIKNSISFLFGLAIFVLVQLIVIGIFLFAFESNSVVAIENTQQLKIKADSVEYRTLARTGKKASNNKLYIICGSKEFIYQDLLCYHYDGDDLVEDLRTQTLTLTIENDTERVVDLRGEKDLFYTLDDFNKTARIRNTMGITILVAIELVYTFVFVLYLRCTDIPWNKIKDVNKKIAKTESEFDSINTNLKDIKTKIDGNH